MWPHEQAQEARCGNWNVKNNIVVQTTAAERRRPELTVILPVYNEEAVIETVVREWAESLDALEIDFSIRAYDDGSTDKSFEILQRLAGTTSCTLRVAHHSNRGHGPTILRGYREARGEWVLQVDSDAEVSPSDFEGMWRTRSSWDFVLGFRTGRSVPLPRRLVSALARWTVRTTFGPSLRDVNCPFRLMRRVALQRLLRHMPDVAFAPNVLLSGLAGAMGLRIKELPVQSLPGGCSRGGALRLGVGVCRAFIDTVFTAFCYRCKLDPECSLPIDDGE